MKSLMNAPETLNGKNLKYEEVFRSMHKSYSMADKMLEAIRKTHSSERGWVELNCDISQTPKGYILEVSYANYQKE